MSCSDRCSSFLASCFFCCHQPCAVLEDQERRRPLLRRVFPDTTTTKDNLHASSSNGKEDDKTNGAALYMRAVASAFRNNFEKDEELQPVWQSLSNVEIISAVYYMTRHRASRLERGLVKPPAPRYEGFRFSSNPPLTPDDFSDWIFSAEAAYLEDVDNLRKKLSEQRHTLQSFAAPVELFEPAYYVSLNHSSIGETCVVIGVKGTSSAVDWLTSLWIEKEEIRLNVPKDGDDSRDFGVHGGILHAARYLLGKIDGSLRKYRKVKKIVFVGHSLGAAVATVCALLLREEHEMQNVFCYAFAPPPVMSLALSRRARGYIFSIVNNDDVVPRTSTKQLKTLLANIRRAVDKYNEVGKDWSKVEAVWEESDWGELEQQFANEWREGRFDTFVAGRILFLYDFGGANVGHVEVDCTADTLRLAILSSRMVSDHLLDAYKAGLHPPYFVM